MALATADILLTDQISILRTSFNSLKAEFGDFTFDPYTDALTLDNDLTLTGNLTIDGEAYFDGTYLMLNWGNSSITNGGLRIDRGSAGNDAVLRFDESDDLWKVGLYGGSFTAISLSGHTHDSRYYTESEVDALLTSYYTSSEVDILLADYLQIDSDITGTPKVFMHQGAVNDDAAVELPAITNSGFGWVVAGSDEEHSIFTIDADGVVTLISNSTNVVANADTDANLCIGNAAAPYEPAEITNKLGASKNLVIMLWYN